MVLIQFCGSIALLLGACSAAPILEHEWNSIKVPLPSSDPWYHNFTNSACDLASLEPGDVIDKRAVEIPSFLSGSVSSAWQVKFRTTDSRFQPTWAVTTLYSPKKRDNLALVSYQHFTDSADIDKSPSYNIINHDIVDGAAWKTFVGPLAETWYVNLPDYEGPGASFGAGHMSGHATLDSIRAVRRLGSQYTGLPDNAPVAMWGYSGGALATEWAVERQGSYAPELKITAAVIGGLTPNTTRTFGITSERKSTYAWLIPNTVRGLASQFPQIKPDLVEATNASTWEEAVHDLMDAADDQTGEFEDLRDVLDSLLGKFNFKVALSFDGLMGYSGVPLMPIFLYHADHDQLAPVEDVRELKDRYCQVDDVSISFQISTISTWAIGDAHINEGIRGAAEAQNRWLPDAFAGKLPNGCTETKTLR
ncbi:secretory lipase-domain-containing protein [Rhypophila decipiens]|uniref:Secretory lipase-domain-containing protein n=1 Tax=Rhypophila decipiens TaxID=261697 RepID=A0AAN7B4L6_9PEZI|nr:secretory lipase-domain-containing protein [Rhypophila decipiens]